MKRRSNRKGLSVFDGRTVNVDSLMSLFDRLSRKRRHPVNPTEAARFNLVCCAEHALRFGKPPLRLFRWMIGQWPASHKNINFADEERALERLRDWRREQSGPPVACVAELARRLRRKK